MAEVGPVQFARVALNDCAALLQLKSMPDHTALYRFLRRLDEEATDRALREVVHRIPLPDRVAGHE